MASNFKIPAGTDLDLVFKARGGSAARGNVGLKVGGQDLADRYFASTGAGDRVASNTSFRWNDAGTYRDIKEAFRDYAYVDDPLITGQPSAQTKQVGQSVTFSVTATGTAPITYQWRKGGANISGATSASLTFTVATADAGSYDCVVTGLAAVTSSAVALRVSATITADPTGGPLNVGDVLSVEVTADGEATLTYQWRKDGVDIGGATSATLTFATSSIDDSGDYDCVVANAYGSDTSAAAVFTVNDVAPVITSAAGMGGPYTVPDGAVINLGVTASGTNLLYEWFDDGVSVGFYGSTHNFGVRNYADYAGYPVNFSVVVSNAAGSDSDAAAVTITPSV